MAADRERNQGIPSPVGALPDAAGALDGGGERIATHAAVRPEGLWRERVGVAPGSGRRVQPPRSTCHHEGERVGRLDPVDGGGDAGGGLKLWG